MRYYCVVDGPDDPGSDETLDDAVGRFLDGLSSDELQELLDRDAVVDVGRYEPMDIQSDTVSAEDVADNIISELDSNYCDCSENHMSGRQKRELRALCQEAIDYAYANYEPCKLEMISSECVSLRSWIDDTKWELPDGVELKDAKPEAENAQRVSGFDRAAEPDEDDEDDEEEDDEPEDDEEEEEEEDEDDPNDEEDEPEEEED